MATILNAGDLILQTTDPRIVRTELPTNLVVPAVKEIKLSASANAFRVTNTEVSDLTEITLIASLIHIEESSTVSITIGPGGTLSPHSVEGIDSDKTAKLLFTDMTSTSVRITATVTEYAGTPEAKTYTTFIDVVKVQDGYDAEYLIVSGEQVFKHLPASTIPVNTSVTLTARLYGHLTLYQWQYYNKTSSQWTDITGATSSTYNLTYNFSAWGTDNNLSIRCSSFYSLRNTTYTDEVTVVKIYDGVKGITPVLTNSSHTIPSNSDGKVDATAYGNSGTQIQLYDGATAMQYTTNTNLTAGQFKLVSRTVLPATGDITVGTPATLLRSGVNVGVTIGNHSAMSNTVDLVRITYLVQARRYGDDSNLEANWVSFTLDQTVTKSKAGNDSKILRIRSDGLVFTKKKDNTISPATIKLSSVKQNITVAPTWSGTTFRSSATAGSTVLTGAALQTNADVYVHASDLGSNTSVDVILTAVQPNSLNVNPQTFTDTEKIILVVEGTDGLSTSMSNAAHTMPSNEFKTLEAADYVGSGTTIRVFEGAEELDYVDYNAAYAASGGILSTDRKKFTINRSNLVVTPNSGITVGAFSDATPGMIVADHSSMAVNEKLVTIEYPITVRRADGTDRTLKLIQTITKSVAGADAKALKLSANAVTFKYDTAGVASPSIQTITFTAALQNIGTASPTFVCKLFAANGTETTGSLGNTSATEKTLTIDDFGTASYATVECSLTYRQVFYTDKITVFKVQDGAEGEPGVSPPRSSFRSLGDVFGLYLSGVNADWIDNTGVGTVNGYTASTVIWRQLQNTGDAPVGSTAHLVKGDEVTLRSADGLHIATRYWDGSAWRFAGKVIDGNLLVQGSVSAQAIDVANLTANNLFGRSIQIKDSNNQVIFSANSGLNGAYISNGTIDSAKIGDAQITTAKIVDANITTLKVAGLAVSNVKSAVTGVDRIQEIDPGGNYTDFNNLLYYDSEGSPVYGTYYVPPTYALATVIHYSGGSNLGSPAWWSSEKFTNGELVFYGIPGDVVAQQITVISTLTVSASSNPSNVGFSFQYRSWPNGGWIDFPNGQMQTSTPGAFTTTHTGIASVSPGFGGQLEIRVGTSNPPNGGGGFWQNSVLRVVGIVTLR
jgi:hypothetical protein